jgi:type II secretory ATPase GspE/PulE/Tfp pilus assembly ATPase PilB-like protein
MQQISGKIQIEKDILDQAADEVKNLTGFQSSINASLEKDTSSILKTILAGAISLGCSDLHLEAQEKQAKLRARLDGCLHDVMVFEPEKQALLTSRIKLLSGLKLNVEDKPQDGRFSIVMPDLEIEIRSSTLPTQFGETAVLRILNPKNLISLEDLGLRSDLYEIFTGEIKKPNGMIIVTGPTGSGKTTTLYAFLKKIRDPEIKIITIEDPIEYRLDDISQTQVAPEKGYDFASGLKSIVRQDPDVILVGEIRDLETAEIALQASLTGHLVFSTLHTNDAAGTISRLTSMEVKAYNIGPAINLIIAQRLVRKICKKCAEPRPATLEEIKKIEEALKDTPLEILKNYPKIEGLVVHDPKGCEYCNSTGYKGRIGIYEAIKRDSELENFIATNPTTAQLAKKAKEKGMIPMKADGFLKILEGTTTIEEIEGAVG